MHSSELRDCQVLFVAFHIVLLTWRLMLYVWYRTCSAPRRSPRYEASYVDAYWYRIFLENGRIFLQNAGFFCKFIETRWKILRYIQFDVAYVGPRPILS